MGVALSCLLGAISDTVITLVPDAGVLSNDFRVGSFSSVTYQKLLPALAVTLVVLVLLFTLSNELEVLALGDESAKGLAEHQLDADAVSAFGGIAGRCGSQRLRVAVLCGASGAPCGAQDRRDPFQAPVALERSAWRRLCGAVRYPFQGVVLALRNSRGHYDGLSGSTLLSVHSCEGKRGTQPCLK